MKKITLLIFLMSTYVFTQAKTEVEEQRKPNTMLFGEVLADDASSALLYRHKARKYLINAPQSLAEGTASTKSGKNNKGRWSFPSALVV